MTILKFAALTLLIVCNLSANALAQDKNKQKEMQTKRISKKYPLVYLSYEQSRKILANTAEEPERLWLRLHNNSRSSIRLEASGANKKYGDVRLYYDILNSMEEIEDRVICHVCSIIKLQPGKTLLFSIPRENIAEDFILRFKFNYDWENLDNVFGGLKPNRYVQLKLSNLSKKEK